MVGQILGHYRIEERLAFGGMGVVYDGRGGLIHSSRRITIHFQNVSDYVQVLAFQPMRLARRSEPFDNRDWNFSATVQEAAHHVDCSLLVAKFLPSTSTHKRE